MALAVLQTTSGGNGVNAADTDTQIFSSATTTGSLYVVAVGVFNTSGAPAAGNVTDNAGGGSNTYQLAGNTAGWGAAIEAAGLWYNSNGTRGGTHQVTVNPPGASSSIHTTLIEVAGQDITSSTSCFDATTFAVANDTTSPFVIGAGGAISGNQIAFHLNCIGGQSGGTNYTQPTGYTNVSNVVDANSFLVWGCDYKINETGTPSLSSTWNGTVGSESPKQLFATFKEAGAGGAVTSGGPQLTFDQTTTTFVQGPFTVDQYGPELSIDSQVTSADQATTGVIFAGAAIVGSTGHDASVTGLIEAGAGPVSTSGHDAILSGVVVAGASVYSIPTDQATTGIIYAAAVIYSSVGHDANVTGLIEAAADVVATAGHDAQVTGTVQAGADVVSTVSHAAQVTGLIAAGADVVSTVSHIATMTGLIAAGASVTGIPTHNVSLTGSIFAGAVITTSPSTDKATTGVIYAGASVGAPVGHDASATGLIAAGAWASSPVGHDALINAAVIASGANPRALVGHDANVQAVIAGGVAPYTPIIHSAQVGGLLVAGAVAWAPIRHDAVVAGRIFGGMFGFFVKPPDTPADDVDLVFVEQTMIIFREQDWIVYVEQDGIETRDEDWITYVEQPNIENREGT
jgi:hypothetical protein